LLAENSSPIHLLSGLSGVILVVISDKCIALASVVGVGDGTVLLKLSLKLRVGSPFIDSVDKELASLLSVGSHGSGGQVGLSLSLKQDHDKPASAGP